MTFGASVTGWLMLTLAALLQGSLFAMTATTWRGWSSIVFLGLFGTALAFTWYAEAVQRIGATRSESARRARRHSSIWCRSAPSSSAPCCSASGRGSPY